MSTRKHLVAFAAQLVPAILFATSINVTFDTALTNATAVTQWEYSEKILISQDGGEHIYFKSLNSFITLRECSFNITSVVLRLSCSNSNPPRRLYITTEASDSQQTQNVTKENKIEEQQFFFPAYTAVRSFKIILEGSTNTGSWHLYSAVISGVPLIEAPTNLQSDEIKGTRCRLLWTNPENAVSNKIDVLQITRQEEICTTLASYDFSSFTNNTPQPKDCYDKATLQMENYPAFSGTNLYKAANATGIVQISTVKAQGYLCYNINEIRAELDKVTDAWLTISAKQHATDISGKWKLRVSQIDDLGTTNRTVEIDLTGDFPSSPYQISISEPNTCQAIFMRPSDDTGGGRRILIDSVSIVSDYSPASVSTNLVKTVFASGTTATIRGLSTYSSYIASITAFDADGNESEPSEPISFMTNGAELPLVIRLQ